jgi:protein TonB
VLAADATSCLRGGATQPPTPVMPAPFDRTRPPHGMSGSWIGSATSLAIHAALVAALVVYDPWLLGSPPAYDDDEVSVELVDAPPASPSASQERAIGSGEQQPPPDAMAIDTQPPAAAVPRSEAQSQAQPPPPQVPPVLQAKGSLEDRQRDEAAAARLRAQQLIEREKRERAEDAARERIHRQAEQAKREQGARAAAQVDAKGADDAKRQAEAKAADLSAAKTVALVAASSAYRGLVLGRLAGFKRYPPAARARGAQGNPVIAFSVDASGHVVSVSLTHGSGDADIDAEVVAMVKRASPFPPPPSGAPHAFSAGINFRLQ